jgi:hypothetical protein
MSIGLSPRSDPLTSIFSAMPSPESFFRAHGLEPLAWDAVLTRVGERLGPAEADTFARLHRAFVAYPAEHTCRAFYDFCARRDLLDLLASYRFDRLCDIAASLSQTDPELPLRGARVLDWGAGGGALAAWLRDERGAQVSASDLSPATAERLAARGFPPPAPGETFDFILCADSLGEIHADEDDWLADEGNAGDESFSGELDARYGLVPKLAALATWLAPGGTVLLFEPVAQEHFWQGAARLLEDAGWRAEMLGPAPAWHLRLQRQE